MKRNKNDLPLNVSIKISVGEGTAASKSISSSSTLHFGLVGVAIFLDAFQVDGYTNGNKCDGTKNDENVGLIIQKRNFVTFMPSKN